MFNISYIFTFEINSPGWSPIDHLLINLQRKWLIRDYPQINIFNYGIALTMQPKMDNFSSSEGKLCIMYTASNIDC